MIYNLLEDKIETNTSPDKIVDFKLPNNPSFTLEFLISFCISSKNWLNAKIEEDISVDSENPEVEVISYNRKDISCELCKEKLPDYVKHNDRYYNISFYKPKFNEFIVLEKINHFNFINDIFLIKFNNTFR